MSLEWKTVTLGSCCNFQEGYVNPSQKNPEYFNGDIKWIRAVDLNDSYVYETSRTLTREGYNSAGKSALLFKPNTIVISKSGTVGRLGIIKDYMCGNRATINIIPHNNISMKFIFYVLKYHQRHFKDMAVGSVQKNLYVSILENLEIPLPSIEVQNKIATVLSNIDDKIDCMNKINKNLNHQRKLLFKNWFIDFNDFSDYELYDTAFGLIPKTWHIYDFKEILTKRTEKSNDDSIPMFSVTNTGIHPREDKFNKKLSASTSKFKLIYKNDLVFGMSREILNWGLMEEQIGGVSSAYNVFRINEEKINPFYLKSFIENYMPYFKDIIKPASREGQGIDQNVLLIKQIYVPPENIFNEFYNIDINFNKLINLNKIKIDKLTNLRDVLLPKLMSGEIDVSNINCE